MTGRDHLGPEELSALVDGLDPGGARRHTEECPSCSARLQATAAAAAAVQASAVTVPPVPTRRREAAVAAALDALDATSPGGDAAGVRRLGNQPARVLGALAAAAALIVAAVVGWSHVDGGAPSHLHSTAGPAASSAAAPARGPGPVLGGAAAGSSGASATAGSATAGSAGATEVQFGALSGPQAVVSAVDAALARAPESNSGAVPSAASGTGSTGGGTGGAPTAGAPTAGASPAVPSPAAAGAAAAPACPPPARLFSPAVPTLVLQGDATYRFTPVQVFVFATPSGRWAVVVARSGCSVLARLAV